MHPQPADSHILGLGTALPGHGSKQVLAERFFTRVLEHGEPTRQRDRALRLVERIYPHSGIEMRYSVLPDYAADDPLDFEFYPSNWALEPFPTTAQRMKIFEKASVELTERAARRALDQARIAPSRVTHLIVCTCTGFFAPGPDVLLIHRLGLPPSVKRTLIGFMGCHAGFNGMHSADQIVRSDPDTVVLQICVELCSLHFQKRTVTDFMIANCLFADGCAAVVYGSQPASDAASPPLFRLGASHSYVGAGSRDQMTWHIGDTGFEMRISARVPASLRTLAPSFVRALLDRAGLERSGVGGWALHPGGSKIVEALATALQLRDTDIGSSLDVLRDHGNMSSATIFFVLQRLLQTGALNGPTVALGFGPGLSVEGAVLYPC